MQDDVLGRNPSGKTTRELHQHDLGHLDIEGSAGHDGGDVQAAGADGKSPQAAIGGRVAVGSEERLARDTKPLQVDLVADAVAWP